MARARNLKPGFFRNEVLGELGVEAAYFFEGLWCQADRDGVVENRPLRLKVEICPYWNWDVKAIIESLEKSGLIRCYSRDGRDCIYIVNFAKHQNPHHKEQASDLPRPDLTVSACNTTSLEKPGQAPDKPETSRADSLNPITDSLNPISVGESPPTTKSRFDLFWSVYPKKVKRKPAADLWKRKKLDAVADQLVADVQNRITNDGRWRDGFIPDPTTYLNQERWNDAIQPIQKTKTLTRPTTDSGWLELAEQYGVRTKGKGYQQLWSEILAAQGAGQ